VFRGEVFDTPSGEQAATPAAEQADAPRPPAQA